MYIEAMTWKWGFWIKANGKGFRLATQTYPLFSERYGYRKVYRFCGLQFEILHKSKENE